QLVDAAADLHQPVNQRLVHTVHPHINFLEPGHLLRREPELFLQTEKDGDRPGFVPRALLAPKLRIHPHQEKGEQRNQKANLHWRLLRTVLKPCPRTAWAVLLVQQVTTRRWRRKGP